MNVDRFTKRVEVLKYALDNFREKVRAAFWDSYDKANREHKAAFIRELIAGIRGATDWDQKVIAGEIGVTPQALSMWKANGDANLDNLQRLLDLADEVGVERPDFEPAIERYKVAIKGAMQCLLATVGESANCYLSDDMFEWILRIPFESWAMVADDKDLLNSLFQCWLSEFPETSEACSPDDLFNEWVPTLIVCADEFNQKGVRP